MKKFFIIGIILLLIAILVTLFFRIKNPIQSGTPPVATYTDIGTSVLSPETIATVKVFTDEGAVNPVDVTKLPEFEDVGDGVFILDGTRSNKEASFSMTYTKTDNSYSIALLSDPIPANRIVASNYLLEVLNISQADACKLNVYIGTIYSVNEELSGRNFGLSFCPGSEKL